MRESGSGGSMRSTRAVLACAAALIREVAGDRYCFDREGPCYTCAADPGPQETAECGAEPVCPNGTIAVQWTSMCQEVAAVRPWRSCGAECGGGTRTREMVLHADAQTSNDTSRPDLSNASLLLRQEMPCNRRPCGHLGRMIRVDSYIPHAPLVPRPYPPLRIGVPPDVRWFESTVSRRQNDKNWDTESEDGYIRPAIPFTVVAAGDGGFELIAAWRTRGGVALAQWPLASPTEAPAEPLAPVPTWTQLHPDAAEARAVANGALLLLLHNGSLVLRTYSAEVNTSTHDVTVASSLNPAAGDSRLVRGAGNSVSFLGAVSTSYNASYPDSVGSSGVETYFRLDAPGEPPTPVESASVEELPWRYRCAPASGQHMIYHSKFDTFISLCVRSCPWHELRLFPSGSAATAFKQKGMAADSGTRIINVPSHCTAKTLWVEIGGMVPTPTGVVVLLALSTAVRGREDEYAAAVEHEPSESIDLVWVNVTSNWTTGDGAWHVTEFRWYEPDAAAATRKQLPRIAPLQANPVGAKSSPEDQPQSYLIGWVEDGRYMVARLRADLTLDGEAEEVTSWAPWSALDNWYVHPETKEIMWVGAWDFHQKSLAEFVPGGADLPPSGILAESVSGIRVTVARVGNWHEAMIDSSPALRCQAQSAASRLGTSADVTVEGCSEEYRIRGTTDYDSSDAGLIIAVSLVVTAILARIAYMVYRSRRRRIGNSDRQTFNRHPWEDPEQEAMMEYVDVPKVTPAAPVLPGAGWGR